MFQILMKLRTMQHFLIKDMVPMKTSMHNGNKTIHPRGRVVLSYGIFSAGICNYTTYILRVSHKVSLEMSSGDFDDHSIRHLQGSH